MADRSYTAFTPILRFTASRPVDPEAGFLVALFGLLAVFAAQLLVPSSAGLRR